MVPGIVVGVAVALAVASCGARKVQSNDSDRPVSYAESIATQSQGDFSDPPNPKGAVAADRYLAAPGVRGNRSRRAGRRPLPVIIAEMVTALIEQAVADAEHPWTVNWPTAIEMASQFGTSLSTMRRALKKLEGQGLIVKARVPRPDGYQISWVPRVRQAAYPPVLTDQQIAADIMAKTLNGEWETLPTVRELQAHFRVDGESILRVLNDLADRGIAHKLRRDGYWRWHIVPPHKIRSIDPRTAIPGRRAALGDIIHRIRAGEFRYRLPDGSIHERLFLTVVEIQQQYSVSDQTGRSIKAELLSLNLIVPGPVSIGLGARAQLAEHIPVVALRAHPPSPVPLKPGDRARELAADLIARIRAGEFRNGKALKLTGTARHYGAGRDNVRAAFDQLHNEGWVEFRYTSRGRFVVLADPLPTADREARGKAEGPPTAEITAVPIPPASRQHSAAVCGTPNSADTIETTFAQTSPEHRGRT